MLWCEIGRSDARAIEHLATFVSQLTALGVRAGIDIRSVPSELHRSVRFDIAPYLLDGPVAPDDAVVLIAADRLTDAKLVELRRLGGSEPRRCVAFGSFDSRQKLIGVRAKLSYVLNREPRMVDLAADAMPGFDAGGDCPVFGVPRHRKPGDAASDRPRLLVATSALDDTRLAASLSALALSRDFEVAILTHGDAKKKWLSERGTDIPIYNHGEMFPRELAEQADILACTAPLEKNYRLQCLVANLAASGVALLDCTADHAIARAADAFVRAPSDLFNLVPFMRDGIIPNLGEIGNHVRRSTLAERVGGARVASLLGAAAPVAVSAAPVVVAHRMLAERTRRVVFMPTNGIGLGHAQRCTLVAAELDRRRVDPVFAAFPSCTGLIKAYGFDVMPLVQRSALHARPYDNDLVNYVRLRALTAEARTLVFDGGFVFDSVYRTIVENRLAGVWLRRGLWQATQDNTVALDRAKVFARIIVPTEAFDELNDRTRDGDRLCRVGPIVQRTGLDAAGMEGVRAELAHRYGVDFGRLVVTQLGGGVAADRGPQIQALCGIMERRPDVLHLVLVWPNTPVPPGWFGWSRSRIVRTHHAGVLAAAADLCISAAGYNSFHEILYGALPAIFIPQASALIDDQTARARSARDRGLAGMVEPHRLMALDRAVVQYLDDGEGAACRRRLAAHELPEPGNRPAAALIEEVTDARGSLDRPRLADRSAGHG